VIFIYHEIINEHLVHNGFVGVKYPGYFGSPVMAQNSGYDRFHPAANDWRTIHPIPDKAPPPQAEDEGPPTEKELILGVIHAYPFSTVRWVRADRISPPV
jgi:hypothetical protein